jgi:cyanoexosortase A
MAVSSFPWFKVRTYLLDAKMWLFFATANLALWHGVINNRIGSKDLVTTSFFWFVTLFLLWKRRENLVIAPKPLATLVGFSILGWVIYRGLALFWFENFLVQLLPLPALFALALIASGWGGLKQYLRPFLALVTFSVLGSLIELFLKSHPAGFSLPEFTAQVSSFLLHYLGFDVMQEGVFIALINSGRGVEVIYYCTGGPLIALMLQLTLGLVLVVPLNRRLISKFLIYLVSIGFILGCIRVIILTMLVGEPGFHYWHGPQGNKIFSLIAFTIWIISFNFIYEHHRKNNSAQSSNSEENNREENEESDAFSSRDSLTNLSLFSPRAWFLPLASLSIATATIATLTIPQIGRKEVKPLSFPSQLSLASWKEKASVSLVNANEQTETKLHPNRVRSGQKYRYQNSETEVAVALRFLSPTFGEVESYIKKTYDQSLQTAYRQGKTSYIRNLGHYRLFQDGTRAYLSACLTPEGESTVSLTDYMNKTNAGVFQWEYVIPRLLGTKSLRERRCLWVHLSTPLEQQSPEQSYRLLESVFGEGYSQWQSLF